MELQRRAQDEELLERLKRRVAGDKVDVPRAVQRLKSFLTPRTGRGGDSGSGLTTPASSSARRPLSAAVVAPLAQQNAAGSADGLRLDTSEGQRPPAHGWTAWWPRVRHAAEHLTAHPDFQALVMSVILLNCLGEASNSPGRSASFWRNHWHCNAPNPPL